MERAKRAFEGTEGYEAGYRDGFEDFRDKLLKWVDSILEDNPHYEIKDMIKIIKILQR